MVEVANVIFINDVMFRFLSYCYIIQAVVGACFSPLPFESFGLAGREVLDLVSSLVKKASESLNIDFALLLSQSGEHSLLVKYVIKMIFIYISYN